MELIITRKRTDKVVLNMKITVFIALLTIAGLSATDSTARDIKALAFGPNPHSENADCSVCHVAPAEKLQSWFTFTSTKKKLKTDLNEVCERCHGRNFGHSVGKKPALNRAALPVAGDDTITCATTCHDMHIRSADQKQQFYHLRLPFDSLCVSCHNK